MAAGARQVGPAAPSATDVGRRLQGVPDVGKGVVGVIGLIALWELARVVGVLPSASAPSMVTIFATFGSELVGGTLASAMLRSLQTWASGMGATLAVAVPLGLLIGTWRWADALLSLTFDFLRPVPAVAFVPVAVIFFGLGTQMEVFLIVIASIWPIVYNVRFGIRALDPLLLDTARTLRLSRAQILWRIRLPAMLPSLFTGIRISASIAVVLVIVAELVASARGIGHYVEGMRQNGMYPQAWAGLLAAGLFGYVIAVLASWVEHRAVAWHHGSKAVSP